MSYEGAAEADCSGLQGDSGAVDGTYEPMERMSEETGEIEEVGGHMDETEFIPTSHHQSRNNSARSFSPSVLTTMTFIIGAIALL